MRVSIGLPFLNAEATLEETVRSVFAQTFGDWELLLVDDGSTDRSLEIAMAIGDRRVRVMSDGSSLGLQKRLNQIAVMASGDYIARMDADDVMHPERLSRQVGCLDSESGVDVVGAAIYVIDAASDLKGIRHDDPIETTPRAILQYGFICHPTAMARADWFRRFPYDESFTAAEDHELFSRSAGSSRLVRLAEPLLYYRETHKNPAAYLARYKMHNRHMRRCYLMHGPAAVGWFRTVKLVMQSYAKVAAYTAATAASKQEAVMNRRSLRALTEAELRHAADGLRIVHETAVPGLESPVEASRK